MKPEIQKTVNEAADLDASIAKKQVATAIAGGLLGGLGGIVIGNGTPLATTAAVYGSGAGVAGGLMLSDLLTRKNQVKLDFAKYDAQTQILHDNIYADAKGAMTVLPPPPMNLPSMQGQPGPQGRKASFLT